MNNLPALSFLPAEIYGDSMVVDEIDFVVQEGNTVAPFKGSKFIVYPGETSPLDLHEVKECWFVAAGTGVVNYCDETKTSVKQGDVLFFDSKKSHEVYNNGIENLLIFSVWWSK